MEKKQVIPIFIQEPHEYRGHLGQIHKGRYSRPLGMVRDVKEWEDEGLDEEVTHALKKEEDRRRMGQAIERTYSQAPPHPPLHVLAKQIEEEEDEKLRKQMKKEKDAILHQLQIKEAKKAELRRKLKAQEEREQRGDLDRLRTQKRTGFGIGHFNIVSGDVLRYGNKWGSKGLNFIRGMLNDNGLESEESSSSIQ